MNPVDPIFLSVLAHSMVQNRNRQNSNNSPPPSEKAQIIAAIICSSLFGAFLIWAFTL